MRKIWMILCLAGMFACSGPDGEKAEISGVIENMQEAEVEVMYYKDLLLNSEESVTVPVSADGTFKASLPLGQGEFVSIRTAQRTINLYAKPGTQLQVVFDAENRDVKPTIEGKQVLESSFLVDYHDDIEKELSSGLIINRLAAMDTEVFVQYVDSVYAKKLGYLMDYPDFAQLDTGFAETMETSIKYEKYRLLLEYPLYYGYFNQLAESKEMPSGYYDFLTDATNFESSDFKEDMRSRAYVSFLSSYLNHLLQQLPEEEQQGRSYFENQYAVAKNAFSGNSRDFLLAQVMISALNFDDFDTSNALYEDFLNAAGKGEFRQMVADEYRVIQALAPGNPAPDFTGVDINGDPITLSDYRGQVVYLDFWASWCGPCMREMPFAKELKQKMASQLDLVFMYVSIDTDEEAWRNTVDLHGIQGVHLNFSGTGHGAPKLYNVKGVPTFYIIGRDGRIYDNRAPRPSNPAIYESLMTALLE
jgi:thiol-disulfide isomerase/thioredoxin